MLAPHSLLALGSVYRIAASVGGSLRDRRGLSPVPATLPVKPPLPHPALMGRSGVRPAPSQMLHTGHPSDANQAHPLNPVLALPRTSPVSLPGSCCKGSHRSSGGVPHGHGGPGEGGATPSSPPGLCTGRSLLCLHLPSLGSRCPPPPTPSFSSLALLCAISHSSLLQPPPGDLKPLGALCLAQSRLLPQNAGCCRTPRPAFIEH